MLAFLKIALPHRLRAVPMTIAIGYICQIIPSLKEFISE